MKTRFLAGGLLAAAALAACAPDIEMDGSAAPMSTVDFDPGAVPAVVPTPNDLAMKSGRVSAPIDPSSPAAQQEFTRDYLNTLDGFPTGAVATAHVTGGVQGTTVNARSVRVLALNGRAVDGVRIQWNAEQGTISVAPPATGWLKGGQYAVAILGGQDGVKNPAGRPVEASTTWAFVRSATPLVTCQDLTASDCRPTTELIPSSETDPARKLADQTKKALALEQLRRLYKGPLDLLEAQGVAREQVALLWTWRTMSLPEVVFNPALGVVPFPSDLLRNPATGKVNLPIAANAPAAQKALLGGLNTLDGFSTTAMMVSENSDAAGAIDVGELPRPLPAGAVPFFNTATGALANATVCVGCGSSLKEDGSEQTGPQQLQIIPNVPLAEKSTYAAVIPTALRNTAGQALNPSTTFALVRLKASLLDGTRSTVSVLSDAQAAQLEPLRRAMAPLFDALAAGPLKLERKNIALAWTVTTQSTVSVLKALHAAASQGPASAVSAAPDYVVDITSRVPAMPGVAKVFEGQFSTPFPLTMTGAQKVRFLLALPTTAAPEAGYRVAVFGHGLGGNRTHALRLASTLASTGRATLATDVTMHGERSSCVGAGALLAASIPGATDDSACADPATQACDADATHASYGRCVARDRGAASACDATQASSDLVCAAAGQGRCMADGKCEGGDFRRSAGVPVVSGNGILNTSNLFATRDNFRQQVVDLASLEHVLQGQAFRDALAAANHDVDGNPVPVALATERLDYAGQSLGGILGTLYTAASPRVDRSVLNVPGGDPAGILLTAESFTAQRNAFVGSLKAQGINPGTPAYDNFLVIARWILDPADPRNAAAAMLNGAGVPAGRGVLVQYITQDQTIPNWTTEAMLAAANAAPVKPAVSVFDPSTTDVPLAARHGFLLTNTTVTAAGQAQVATFLETGAAQ